MQKISLTAALLAATLSTAAMAEDWVLVSTQSSGLEFYVDRESIRTMQNGNKRAWMRRVYAKPDKWGDTSSRTLEEYDCREGRSRFLQYAYYKGEEGTGTSNDISEWSYAVPGSSGESLLNFVCFGKLPE